MTQRKIRFGILGASRIAQKSVIPSLLSSACAELTMIGTRMPEKIASLPCATGSYEDVLVADIDAVYISLPNSLHEEWTIKALEAGKHVWCEKPAALTGESAHRMVNVAKKNNVRLMEGFMFLHHSQHAKVRELIESGEIGLVKGFTGAFCFPRPEEGNIRLEKELGGGVYNDAGVYPVRASRMIFQEAPESVAATFSIDPVSGVDVSADLTLTYPNGKSADIHAAFDDDYHSTYTVIGEKGKIEMGRAYAVPKDMSVSIFVHKDGATTEIAIPPVDQFALMIEAFCIEIQKGTEGKEPYEADLLIQARMLEAGRRAASEKRTVELSEIV